MLDLSKLKFTQRKHAVHPDFLCIEGGICIGAEIVVDTAKAAPNYLADVKLEIQKAVYEKLYKDLLEPIHRLEKLACQEIRDFEKSQEAEKVCEEINALLRTGI